MIVTFAGVLDIQARQRGLVARKIVINPYKGSGVTNEGSGGKDLAANIVRTVYKTRIE